MFSFIRDVSAFLVLTSFLTIVMARYWWIVCLMFVVTGIRFAREFIGGESNDERKNMSTFEFKWLNWFEVTKLIAAISGIVAICVFQHTQAKNSEGWHALCSFLLVVNIGEAVVRECQSGVWFLPNAACGIVLLICLPDYNTHVSLSLNTELLEYPLSWSWILLYTTWNAAFTYGFNLSWSTRFQLVSAIVVSTLLFNAKPKTWLHLRTLGLTLNMILRASQVTYLYCPGASALTYAGGSSHNPVVYRPWGAFNLLCAVCFVMMYEFLVVE
jgi:hypothetical protein